jgi:hypothetical protein
MDRVKMHCLDSKLFLAFVLPNIMAESVSPLFRICEIMQSSLGPEPGYSGIGFGCFSQSLQTNAGIVGLALKKSHDRFLSNTFQFVMCLKFTKTIF